jgi:tight adherence protein C
MRRLVGVVLVRVDLVLRRAVDDPSSPAPSPGRAAELLAAVAAGCLLGAPGLLAVVALAVTVRVGRRRRRADAERRLLAEVNDAVPLLQLAAGAGLTVRGALVAVQPWSGTRLGTHVAELLDRVESGASLADEVDELPERLGGSCRGLAAVLGASERYGSPLVEPLARLGSELRLERRRQIEQAARRVPVQLLFPLTLGVLPAFVLLAIVPLAAGALEGVGLPSGLSPGR